MPGPSSITDIVAAHARMAGARTKGDSAAGLSFADVIDAVNPLQHIPVVSWAYRALTGDGIAGAAKMVGGALFGGPVGFVLAAADNLWERASGRDAGDTLVALAKAHDRSTEPLLDLQVAQDDRTDDGLPLWAPVGDIALRASPEQKLEPFPFLEAAQTLPPTGPVWELAAAQLPQNQVDLLLRSVGLAAENPGGRTAATPATRAEEPRMPAVPAAPVAVLELAEAQPMPPAYRQTELTAALAAGQELQRAYRRP